MTYMLNVFRTHKWEAMGTFLLFLVLVINRFPEGYVIVGGDVLQPMKMVKNYAFYYYDWSGRVSIFYGIFYLLDWLRVSETAQLSWYLGLFLFGAYSSFLAFCSLVFPQSSRLVRALIALFYATNVYTLYIFTATWGFTSYQILYVFIPVLTGLYIRSLQFNKSSLFILLFLIASFFTSTSFGNPAFALSLGIYFLFLTLFLLLFKWAPLSAGTLMKIFLMATGAFLLNVYWILPLVPQINSGIQEINNSKSINLSETLRKTSNSIFDTVRLLPTSEQEKYYPANFPYPSVSWMKKVIAFLTFVPFIIVLVGITRKKDARTLKLYGVFSIVFIVFVALVSRERFPFATMNNFLFHLPGLNTLRGWDKLAIFTPFLLSALIFMALMTEYKRKYFKVLISLCFVVIVLLALPFYAGGIQTKMSYILSNQKAKDFQTAKQSALVKVPESYYAVASIFETDKSDYKISMLPYSPGSSVGRVNFPEWKVNGPHIARTLYGKPFIELTEPYIPGWKFAEDFENTQYDPQWITDLYGFIGVKYVFYHKDAKSKSVERFEESRKYLEGIGAMNRMVDNEFFTLYQIEEKRVFPYVYTTNERDVFVKSSPEGLSEKVQSLRKGVSALDYERQNSKKAVVTADKLASQSHIFLNEKYDPLWRAEYISRDGKHTELERDENVRYANTWKVKSSLSGGSVEIYYLPLRLFYIGQWISGIALLVVVIGTVSVLRKKNNS